VSLKDRIREAQIEAAKRLRPKSRRSGIGKALAAGSKGSGGDDDEQSTAPTVEEIRLALLHKSANGKTIE
jgi:hypothetical protein